MFIAQQYLGVLGYGPTERPTLPQLKTRWKELCRKCHPDTGGDEAQFRKVTHAYKILTDAEYRQKVINEEMKKDGNRNLRGDLNVRIVLPISFEEAFFGRMVNVSFNRQHFDASFKPLKLDVQDVQSHLVQIPPGSCAGYEFVLQGGGHVSGSSTGDAIIGFVAQPHERFRVQDHEVIVIEQVPLDVMLKGGKLEFQTMYGVKTAKVKAGSKNGDSVKIRGCGVANRGNHVVMLDAIFPSKDQLKSEAWAGLPIDFSEDEAADAEAEALMRRYKTSGAPVFFTFST